MGLKKNPKLMSKKVFIKTFGCQMNEYDSNRIYESILKIGYKKTEICDEANCYILNTCHIRDKAKEKVYHEIGRVKKNFQAKKKPIVIVAGVIGIALGILIAFVIEYFENTLKDEREKIIELKTSIIKNIRYFLPFKS